MKKDKTWAWIKYRLALQGLSLNKLAFIHKVDRTCFTGVKRKPMPKFERILANSINRDPWELWPSRYDEAHNPNRISSRYQGHKTFEIKKTEVREDKSNGKSGTERN